MKTLLLILLLVPMMSFGQAPESFNYQAVVRDAGGIILNNQAVGMRLTVQQGSIGGTAVYTETFSTTTNGYGLVNLEIGAGTSTDDFTTIDWANGPYFMETSVDFLGGMTWVVMGTSQLMSVPYALYAKTADSVSYLPSESFYYADSDNDTFGNPLAFVYSINNPPGFTTDNTDCDDNNPAVNPGATDIAGNGIDEDCDGQDSPTICGNGIVEFGEQCDDGNTDDNDGCSNCQSYQDNDNDGYYADIDCDDNDATVYPGAPELCDGIINDCNTSSLSNDEVDMDADGFTPCQGDCNDFDYTINPSANDIAGNGIDEDCDGQDTPTICGNGIVEFGEQCDDGNTDDNDGCSNCQSYQDNDNDGYYADIDCDDNDATVYPGAPELCDGIINDCNSISLSNDEVDMDADGFTPCQGDCNDFDPNIYPGAFDIPVNGIDEDCDGQDGQLNIGDTYQGGIIFYLDGNGGGLIAAPSDQSPTEWGCQGTAIQGADGVAIGTGAQNTIDIEAGCATAGTAADICANLNIGGYSDWFLPSFLELNEMYLNIGAGSPLGNLSSFVPNYYWSSSEILSSLGATHARSKSFGDGSPGTAEKGNFGGIRAVRTF